MPAFIVDQLYLITVAVFAVASMGIIVRSRRRQPPSSGRFGLAGLRTAAMASVVPVLILALILLIVGLTLGRAISGMVGSGYTAPPPTVDSASWAWDNFIALLWLVSIPGVTFLAVLDLYAIRPPSPANQAGDAKSFAVLGTLFSLFLLGGTLLVSTMIDEAISDAAWRDAQEAISAERDAEARALEARSAGLSMVVTVVDAELGERTDKGRLVSRLALDVTVRSATDLDLGETKEAVLRLWNPGYYGEITEGMELPAHIPAGFETTYHLEVPTGWSCLGQHVLIADSCSTSGTDYNPPVTGPWEVDFRFANEVPYDDPRHLDYITSTEFTVADAP